MHRDTRDCSDEWLRAHRISRSTSAISSSNTASSAEFASVSRMSRTLCNLDASSSRVACRSRMLLQPGVDVNGGSEEQEGLTGRSGFGWE